MELVISRHNQDPQWQLMGRMVAAAARTYPDSQVYAQAHGRDTMVNFWTNIDTVIVRPDLSADLPEVWLTRAHVHVEEPSFPPDEQDKRWAEMKWWLPNGNVEGLCLRLLPDDTLVEEYTSTDGRSGRRITSQDPTHIEYARERTSRLCDLLDQLSGGEMNLPTSPDSFEN